ncbi:MAG: hypothetical protein H7210_06585 [Pyrinomonadaceae bacterium]|nr:hypothetical protein [Phycisphaerales bacterium]
MAVSVSWIFSLARSGSSIVAYAAAAGFGCPVADEVLGPWDRTVEPYNYPPEQWQLVGAYVRANYVLDQHCILLAQGLFEKMAASGDVAANGPSAVSGGGEPRRLVSKYPHLIEPPDMFEKAFPTHGAAYMLRNPLHRLNSLYARSWFDAISSNHDMDRYKAFARQWLVQPYGLLYDDMKRDPVTFFGRVYKAWRWPADEANVARAVQYVQSTYHGNSGDMEQGGNPSAPRSEQRMLMPLEAVTTYLTDPFILALMERVGWSVNVEDYLPRSGEPSDVNELTVSSK